MVRGRPRRRRRLRKMTCLNVVPNWRGGDNGLLFPNSSTEENNDGDVDAASRMEELTVVVAGPLLRAILMLLLSLSSLLRCLLP